ncbi:hypothetical protein Tco_0923694 [Tanacetum coccineum]|uniref:Uncharacterized protein n=1 Tax=Tanacetum coccineum TaxID=301880 RepID=A0ABQ5D1P9_9ASTR
MSTNEADDEIRAKLLRIGCYFDCDEEIACNEFVEKTEGCLLNAGGVLNAAFMLKNGGMSSYFLQVNQALCYSVDMNFVMGVE